jgi:hypothetical protein
MGGKFQRRGPGRLEMRLGGNVGAKMHLKALRFPSGRLQVIERLLLMEK